MFKCNAQFVLYDDDDGGGGDDVNVDLIYTSPQGDGASQF